MGDPHPLDDTHGPGADAIRAISTEALRALRRLARRDLPPAELLRRAKRILKRHEPLLSRTLADALLAAWVEGAVRAVPPLLLPAFTPSPSPLVAPTTGGPAVATLPAAPPLVRFPQLEIAAARLRAARVVTAAEFASLDQDAKRAAFTISRVASLDALAKVRDALADDVEYGGTLRSFRAEVGPALEGSALSPARIEGVYRDGTGRAYAQGQREILAHPLVSPAFPYAAYYAIHDSRVRPEHLQMEKLGLNGTNVYRMDDPELQRLWPPWSFSCRCHVVPLSIEDAAAAGVREAINWLAHGTPPERPEHVGTIPFASPPAWVPHGLGLDVAV